MAGCSQLAISQQDLLISAERINKKQWDVLWSRLHESARHSHSYLALLCMNSHLVQTMQIKPNKWLHEKVRGFIPADFLTMNGTDAVIDDQGP